MENTGTTAALITVIFILLKVVEYFLKQKWPSKDENKLPCPMGGTDTLIEVNKLQAQLKSAESLRERDTETIIMQQEKFAEYLERTAKTQERISETLEKVCDTLDEIVEKQRTQEMEHKIDDEVEKRVEKRLGLINGKATG